ncbi:MAG: queuosine salvage family protein [Acidimicrobiales bacterium]|nr:queuosine salvage family protein [Acidimicrobiales bacterium]
MASILEQVRSSCGRVAAQARFVSVTDDLGRLHAYAESLLAAPREAVGPWTVDPELEPEQRAATVLCLAAVAFGSGWHPVLRKRPGLSGATTLATNFREWAADTRLSAHSLQLVSPTAAHEIFGQPTDDPAIAELMSHYAVALNDLGSLVADEFDGSFLALVESAEGSAAALVETLDTLPYFRDRAAYRGSTVYFYKRAQLAVADLARAFDGEAPANFFDLHELTAFADNLVPHVLALDGILEVDGELRARVDRGELLESGSEEEVELRACAIHAVEVLAGVVSELGGQATPAQLDQLLWTRGSEPTYKARPRHRTRCVFY